jgi:hypothetical protein
MTRRCCLRVSGRNPVSVSLPLSADNDQIADMKLRRRRANNGPNDCNLTRMRRIAAVNVAKLPGAFAEAVIRSVELIVQPGASVAREAIVDADFDYMDLLLDTEVPVEGHGAIP